MPCGRSATEILVYLTWVGLPGPPIFRLAAWSTALTRKTEPLRTALVDLIEPICNAHGVELVDVRHQRERGGAVIRVIIDRELPGQDDRSGVSLDDCTRVSRDASTVLDVHEDVLPPGGYRLEVSSPGVDRPLVRLSDFERYSGREVKVRTREPIGRRRKFRGMLIGVSDGTIELDQDGTVVHIPHDDIAQANLVYRFEK